MSSVVTVVDYGIGNLLSVCRGFEHIGAEVDLTTDPDRISKAGRLVLPGVGAFANCMAELRARHFVEPVLEYLTRERPFLGICVGMQMMMDASEEFGRHEGLALIGGEVLQIPPAVTEGRHYKVPHIGWSSIDTPAGTEWSDTILSECQDGEPMYFVHTFTAHPDNQAHRLADTDYHGNRISAAIHAGYHYGCQFHPEKSGQAGLSVLRRFVQI